MAAIERAFAPFLVSPDWEPLYPLNTYGVFASQWPLNDQIVWTIVNRNPYDIDVPPKESHLPRNKAFATSTSTMGRGNCA